MIQTFRAEVQRYLLQCDAASTMPQKGKAFEDLMCYLFETIPGITMARRNRKNVFNTEEIDILLWNEFITNGLPSPAFPPFILVECKNWSEKVGSIEVSWFDSKLRNRGLSFGILVAANGITGEPQHLTDAHSIVSKALFEQRRIIVITRSEIEDLTNSNDLVRLIRDKLCDLILTQSCL